MTVQLEVKVIDYEDFGPGEFERYQSPDPFNDYGWFTITVGEVGDPAGSNFQVCVATPRAVGRLKLAGYHPGILVDHYDPETVRQAIVDRVASLKGDHYQELIDQLRTFMHWEYEGMS